jgi:hypothetical protein
VIVASFPAQVPQRGGGDAVAGDELRDAITHVRRAVSEIVEVESTNDLLVLVDEDVTGNDAPHLIGQKFFVSLCELFKEFIASVVNRLRKVVAVRHFELEDGSRVIPAKYL